MTQVSALEEFLTALNRLESNIQITAGFSIPSQISILYPVTIESSDSGNPFVLTKDNSYYTYLFRVMEGGSLTLQNLILDGQRDTHPTDNTNNRSLIYVTGGTLNLLDGAVIRNNNSYLEGGGVYLNSSSAANTLNISGNARITNCYSRTSGGGLMIASSNPNDKYNISGAMQIDNCFAANGGGLYFRTYTEETGGTLTLSDQVQITDNTAGSTGGGIAFSGFRNGGAPASSLTLAGNAFISGNQAVHGAGVYFYAANTGDIFTLSENALLTQNTASQNGGGLHMSANGSSANITIDQAGITKNTAGTGGGIYILTDSGANVALRQTSISENGAVNGDSGSGGGIWMQNQSETDTTTVNISRTNFENNHASAHGGGMILYGGSGPFTFQMENSTISKNQCAKNGGGMLISSGAAAKLTFQQSNILENTAEGYGGGLYCANTAPSSAASLTMTNTVVSSNTAGTEGGGLRLTSGTASLTAALTDCTISNNTAKDSSGGGIWNGGANDFLTLNGSTSVTGNRSDNGNGGGIYFNSDNGTLLVTDNVTVTDNRADAASSDFGGHGGGICLVPGILTIQNQAQISNNHAGKYGGGISAAEKSQILMEGGSIQNNISGQYGGGIWNSSGSIVTLSGGNFTGNQAPEGGGIYNSATLYMEGAQSISDGVYVVNETAIVYLKNPLEADSAVQLESSSYVSPNPEGTPIVVGESTAAYPMLTQADADAFHKPVQGFENWQIQLSEDHTQILLAPLPQYTITFDGNDSCCPKACDIPEPLTFYQGNCFPLPDTVPRRRGFCFTGWSFDACGCGEICLPGEIVTFPNENLTLYAIWKRKSIFCRR